MSPLVVLAVEVKSSLEDLTKDIPKLSFLLDICRRAPPSSIKFEQDPKMAAALGGGGGQSPITSNGPLHHKNYTLDFSLLPSSQPNQYCYIARRNTAFSPVKTVSG